MVLRFNSVGAAGFPPAAETGVPVGAYPGDVAVEAAARYAVDDRHQRTHPYATSRHLELAELYTNPMSSRAVPDVVVGLMMVESSNAVP
jgi:hypothetical protein